MANGILLVIETYIEISLIGEEWIERSIEERHKFHSHRSAQKYIERQMKWADNAPVLDYEIEIKQWGEVSE